MRLPATPRRGRFTPPRRNGSARGARRARAAGIRGGKSPRRRTGARRGRGRRGVHPRRAARGGGGGGRAPNAACGGVGGRREGGRRRLRGGGRVAPPRGWRRRARSGTVTVAVRGGRGQRGREEGVGRRGAGALSLPRVRQAATTARHARGRGRCTRWGPRGVRGADPVDRDGHTRRGPRGPRALGRRHPRRHGCAVGGAIKKDTDSAGVREFSGVWGCRERPRPPRLSGVQGRRQAADRRGQYHPGTGGGGRKCPGRAGQWGRSTT